MKICKKIIINSNITDRLTGSVRCTNQKQAYHNNAGPAIIYFYRSNCVESTFLVNHKFSDLPIINARQNISASFYEKNYLFEPNEIFSYSIIGNKILINRDQSIEVIYSSIEKVITALKLSNDFIFYLKSKGKISEQMKPYPLILIEELEYNLRGKTFYVK